jgi:hypothetical protein
MEEAQAWRQIGDDGRCLVHSRRKCDGRARLVVIFEEAG